MFRVKITDKNESGNSFYFKNKLGILTNYEIFSTRFELVKPNIKSFLTILKNKAILNTNNITDNIE